MKTDQLAVGLTKKNRRRLAVKLSIGGYRLRSAAPGSDQTSVVRGRPRGAEPMLWDCSVVDRNDRATTYASRGTPITTLHIQSEVAPPGGEKRREHSSLFY